MADLTVFPVTAERWDDLVMLFERRGPHGGRPITLGCWCMYWRLDGRTFTKNWGEPNRAALEELVRAGAEPGLLAYADGEPIGWCSLGPRERFSRLERSPVLKRVDDEDVWSITCFYVHGLHRREGTATALLDAALEYAAARGARLVEAYGCRPGDSDPYTGFTAMFDEAGFSPVREGGRRTIMRRRLT